jgi:hypothetical protein
MSRKSPTSKSVKSGSTESKVIEITRGFATVKITWFVASPRHGKNVSDETAARKESASIAEKLNQGQQPTHSR